RLATASFWYGPAPRPPLAPALLWSRIGTATLWPASFPPVVALTLVALIRLRALARVAVAGGLPHVDVRLAARRARRRVDRRHRGVGRRGSDGRRIGTLPVGVRDDLVDQVGLLQSLVPLDTEVRRDLMQLRGDLSLDGTLIGGGHSCSFLEFLLEGLPVPEELLQPCVRARVLIQQ